MREVFRDPLLIISDILLPALCGEGNLDVSERDYTKFDEYFRSAKKECDENDISDAEMDKLSQIRDELAELGWLR